MRDRNLPKTKDEIEAAELAKALERNDGAGNVAEELLETAALLRHAGTRSELGDERKKALLKRVLQDSPPTRETRWWAGWSTRWVAGTALASAVAALALVLALQRDEEMLPTTLPPPPETLLAAQLAAVGGAGDVLDTEMAHYRGDVYGALSRRYGAGE